MMLAMNKIDLEAAALVSRSVEWAAEFRGKQCLIFGWTTTTSVPTEGTASEYCKSYRDTSVGLSTTQRLLSRDSNDRFVITVSEICRQRHTAKIFESITCRYLLSSLDWFVVSNFPVAT